MIGHNITEFHVKINILFEEAQNSDLFKEFPVKKRDWMVPCKNYKDDQEIVVEENLQMPEGFCQSACIAIYPNIRTLGFGGNLPFCRHENVKGIPTSRPRSKKNRGFLGHSIDFFRCGPTACEAQRSRSDQPAAPVH